MLCPAVSPWGAGCVLDAGHLGDHLTEQQRVAREQAAARWEAQRLEFWTAVAERTAARERAKVKEVLHPVVLVPTQAQRAAGVVVLARDDQVPARARSLIQKAQARGWTVLVTYAHAYMPPKRGAEDWWDNHTVAVRLTHPDGRRAWGVWSNGGWDGGQVMGRNVNATELAATIVGDASLDNQSRQLVGSAA